MNKHDIIVEIKENGIFFYKPQEVIRVDTKKKMEEVNQQIFEILKPEEKEKIDKQFNQLLDSFNRQSNVNNINKQIDKILGGNENGKNTHK